MPKPSLEDFGQRLIALLPRLMREISRYDSHYIAEGRITQPQLLVLDHLNRYGPCPMSELAKIMNLHCSSATGLVDRLVREHLVARTHGEKDRRVVTVTLTGTGKSVLKQIYHQKQRGIMKIFSRLSARERKTYIEILEKLFDQLSSRETHAN